MAQPLPGKIYTICIGGGQYEILFFVDGNPNLIGSTVKNLPVRAPKDILCERPDFVIMGILTGYEETKNKLMEAGFPEERIIIKHVDLATRARRQCLKDAARIINMHGVSGAVAELGVYRGDFAKEINHVFPDRTLYLFDTFEGFPQNDLVYDNETELLTNFVGRFQDTSVEFVLNQMPHIEQCVVKKGYFPETTSGLNNEVFAFVSIDVDLYKPILTGLNFFWQNLNKGGYIFVHDYFSESYFGAKRAIDEFAAKENIAFTPIGDTLSVMFSKGG